MRWYFLLLGSLALLRIMELRISRLHQERLLAEDGRLMTEPVYPVMVIVHTMLLLGSAAEVWWLGRAFIPLLGWTMMFLLTACISGRIWVWRSLGEQWSTHVVASTRPIVDA